MTRYQFVLAANRRRAGEAEALCSQSISWLILDRLSVTAFTIMAGVFGAASDPQSPNAAFARSCDKADPILPTLPLVGLVIRPAMRLLAKI